ncbi:MAG TPA: hypothetical protein VJB96_05325 [Patescibacteria group bacterium]|nr:hypothetical protein [Patescibacteria group bacterium]
MQSTEDEPANESDTSGGLPRDELHEALLKAQRISSAQREETQLRLQAAAIRIGERQRAKKLLEKKPA